MRWQWRKCDGKLHPVGRDTPRRHNPTPGFNVTTSLNVTSVITALLAGGSDIPSFLFLADWGQNGAVGVTIALQLNYTSGVAATPLPTALLLFATGLGGLRSARLAQEAEGASGGN